MRRRRWPWLLLGVLLLGVGAWLSRDSPEAQRAARPVTLPRKMTGDEQERVVQRRTLPAVAAPAAPSFAQAPAPLRDPVQAAFPPTVQKAALVMEFNAIRNSDLGPLFIDCMTAGDEPVLEELRDAGVDLLSQVDRLGLADRVFMASGDFSHLAPQRLGNDVRPAGDFGADAELWNNLRADGGIAGTMGVWKKQLLVFGSVEDVKRTLDRLSGSGPTVPGVLTEDMAYGEVYGVLKGAALDDLLDDDDTNQGLADVVHRTASSVELHVDVSHDVGVVADITGTSPRDTQDLRLALSSALSLARLQAKAQGRAEESELLSMARALAPRDGDPRFRMEAGLPYAYLEKSLRRCAENNRQKREARRGGGDAGP